MMTTMQEHPIDVVRSQMALAAQGLGQGVIGLLTALALIGIMWVSALRPADAAGQMLGPDFAASAVAEAHVGAAAVRLDGQSLAGTGVMASSLSVCRLVLDPGAEAPATCTPVGPVVLAPVAN
jgi:hypothetical protein